MKGKTYFNEPDLTFEGEGILLKSLDIKVMYRLVRKSPPLIFSLTEGQKLQLKKHILDPKNPKTAQKNKKSKRAYSATNDLLLQMIEKKQARQINHVLKKQTMNLGKLVGAGALQGFIGSKNTITRETLLKKLQGMIFSEKSAFAQCGIFVSGVVSTVCSQESRFTLRDLQKIEVDIVLACIADTEEYSFLPGLISGVQGAVGRLLLRQEVTEKELVQIPTGGYVDPGNTLWGTREIMTGDASLKYSERSRVSSTDTLTLPLCPDTIDGEPTSKVKIYEIHETVANKVVGGGSRKALAERDFEYVDNKSTILPGQVMILEIPFDSGPHDADIQTVCVDQDGKPLPIIHYPATFLDRVRTFPHADNRVQVEIYNSGTKPIELEDIHFRVRLYTSTDPGAREKWSLRKSLQCGEYKGLHALEYLVRSRILKLSEAQNPRDAQDILSNLPSIVNVFNNSHQKGLIFYQREEQGTAQNMCQVVQRDTEGKITLGQIDIRNITEYHKQLIHSFTNICDVGREKRVTLVCNHGMNIEDLEAIIKNRRVTDILSVPGPMFSHKPKTELVGVCRKYRIPLTSINMVQGSTHRQDAVYDLVGAERG